MKIEYKAILLNIVNELLDLSNIVNILTIITSIITIWGVVHAWRQSKLKIYTQYILNNIFVDRKSALYDISSAINNNDLIINIYGRKGVGKSNFLRFYCDLVNHKLKKNDKKILKKQFNKQYKLLYPKRSKAFYLEISGYQNRDDLNQQISEIVTGKLDFSNIQIAEKLRKAFAFNKKIIIVIDNVNTEGLEFELENIIKTFYSVSHKFCFIIGSVRKLDLLSIVSASKKQIELFNFKEDDIKEFIQYNYPIIRCSILADILELSKGLPILVNLYLNGFKENGKLENNIQVKKYIHKLTETLPEKELKIAQAIALLSITRPRISISLLSHIINNFNENNIENLNANSLIEYHPIKQELKMHDIFRDFINSFYILNEQECISNIYNYFKENSTDYETAYYAILVDDIDTKNSIISTIEKAISVENYSFLLLFGEHIKVTFGFQAIQGNISEEAFYTILLGYLEGLIGVGDYPAAKEIIDKCGLTVRQITSLIQLKTSLLIANLYHLQNQYQESIATYEIILTEINNMTSSSIFFKYEAKCLWGIAHSYRHEGINYALAESYYKDSIQSAHKTNQKSIVLKCHFELATIYILQNNLSAANTELSLINDIFKTLPSDQYIYTRIAYKKVYARYIRVFNIDGKDDLNLLKSVLNEYEKQKKRLQYNTFFDIGEHYRHHEQYTEAIENYSIALNFSLKNHDINLATMSRLGLVLCDICLKKSTPATVHILQNILQECIDNHLYTNKIIAKLIIDIIQHNILSEETQNSLKYLGINFNNTEASFHYIDANKIHLILM